MITIKTGGICEVRGCPKDILVLAKKILTIPNPAYHRVARITGNSWAAERDFKYYKERPDGSFLFPRGFRGRFKAYLDKNKVSYSESESFVDSKTGVLKGWKPVELRDYQVSVVETALGHAEGVIYASVGAGKTVISCEITRRIGLKTTILVPTTIIAEQFKDEFKKWFQYDVGIVGDGKKEIGDITVATWQSLAADESVLKQLVEQTGLLIIDECHGVTSKGRSTILRQFRPERLYGLSGSPRRSKDDGRTDAIFFYLGPVIASHEMTQIKPVVDVIMTKCDIQMDYNYANMVDTMVKNDSRNKLISGLALGEAMSGKKVLVLLKRREHCKLIMDKLGSVGAYYADSDDPERNEVLMKMRSGEYLFNILVGTLSLLGAGVDVPSLDVVIFGGDLKSDVLLQQGAGRVMRLFEGKETCKIYDLVDYGNPIFKNQFYERRKFYKQKGWEMLGSEKK